MRQAVGHLKGALVRLRSVAGAIQRLPHSEKRAMLYAMLSNADRLIDSACGVLERELEEPCEKS